MNHRLRRLANPGRWAAVSAALVIGIPSATLALTAGPASTGPARTGPASTGPARTGTAGAGSARTADATAARAAAVAAPVLDVVPKPAAVTVGSGRFTLARTARIVAAPGGGSAAELAVAEDLAAYLRPATGYPLP